MDCLVNVLKILFYYYFYIILALKKTTVAISLSAAPAIFTFPKPTIGSQTYFASFPFITSSRYLFLKTAYFAYVYRWPSSESRYTKGTVCTYTCVCMWVHTHTPFVLRILCAQVCRTREFESLQSQTPLWILFRLIPTFENLALRLWNFTGIWNNDLWQSWFLVF